MQEASTEVRGEEKIFRHSVNSLMERNALSHEPFSVSFSRFCLTESKRGHFETQWPVQTFVLVYVICTCMLVFICECFFLSQGKNLKIHRSQASRK